MSIIFFNAGTWTITKVMKKEIDSFGTSCYRYKLGIRRINKIRNEDVPKRAIFCTNVSLDLLGTGFIEMTSSCIFLCALITMEEINNEDQGCITTNT